MTLLIEEEFRRYWARISWCCGVFKFVFCCCLTLDKESIKKESFLAMTVWLIVIGCLISLFRAKALVVFWVIWGGGLNMLTDGAAEDESADDDELDVVTKLMGVLFLMADIFLEKIFL